MIALENKNQSESYINNKTLTGCTSSMSPEKEIKMLKERSERLVYKLLETSSWQIFKRNTIIKNLKYCDKRIKQLTIKR